MSQKAGKGGNRPRNPVAPCGRPLGGAGGAGGASKFRDRGRKKDQPGRILVMISRADKPSIAIPGAKVTLVGPGANGAKRQLSTDKQGAAEFKGLPAGDYTFSYVLPQEHLLALPHGSALGIGEGGFDLAAVYVSPVGTLVVEVVDALSGAKVLPPCALQQAAQSPQMVAWDDKLPSPQTFAKVKPGNYSFLASPDPARYEPMLDGKAPGGAATVPAGGTGKLTIKLMPRTWIKFTVWDTHRNRPVGQATVKLQPNGGEAARSKPTDGVNLLEFAMAKKVSACTAVDVDVESDEIYEVTGVGPA